MRAEIERLRAHGIEDVIVVAAFNAQVNALQEALPGIRVGTVDKFQTARREGVSGATEAIEDVQRQGPRSPVVESIVWRFAEQLVEDIVGGVLEVISK